MRWAFRRRTAATRRSPPIRTSTSSTTRRPIICTFRSSWPRSRIASTSCRTSLWRLTSEDARSLWNAAREAGVVHAVTFNYRGNPLVQHAREMTRGRRDRRAALRARRDICRTGCLHPTDFSWRLEPEKGGKSSAIGDIGSHWCDLVQHVIGQRIEAVLAELEHGDCDPIQAREIDRSVRARRGSAATSSRSRARISPPSSCASTAGRAWVGFGRAGLRRTQERPLVRGERPARVAAMASGAAERVVDRPPRCGECDAV